MTTSTPLLSVVSYNILAPVYVRPIDKRTGGVQSFAAFEFISEEDSDEILSMSKRGPRLLQLLHGCEADAIFLQELQLEHESDEVEDDKEGQTYPEYVVPGWIRPLVEKGGGKYTAFLPPQDELRKIAERNVRVHDADAAVTCAIMYMSDRIVPVESSFEDGIDKIFKRDGDTNNSLSLYLKGAPGTDLEGMDPLVLTYLHLDATDEVKRVGQISLCYRRARVLADRKAHEDLPPMIIAGDMNAEFIRGSCIGVFLRRLDVKGNNIEEDSVPAKKDFRKAYGVAHFLRAGTEVTDKQVNKWKDLYANARFIAYDNCVQILRADTGGTHVGLNREDSISEDSSQMRSWCLDHILHTSDRFRPVAVWSTIEDDHATQMVGLPNDKCPSDHMPLGVVLAALPSPSIPDEVRDALILRLDQIVENQSQQYRILEIKLQMQLSENEAQRPEQKMSHKSKKSKHQKPPQDVVALLRQRRVRLKEMKAQQKIERKTLMDALCDAERIAIQSHFGCTAREWVERGGQ